jgi:hypothetical protein
MSLSLMESRYLMSARMLLPCAAISTRLPPRMAGAISSCQAGRKRATVSLRDSVAGRSAAGTPAGASDKNRAEGTSTERGKDWRKPMKYSCGKYAATQQLSR